MSLQKPWSWRTKFLWKVSTFTRLHGVKTHLHNHRRENIWSHLYKPYSTAYGNITGQIKLIVLGLNVQSQRKAEKFILIPRVITTSLWSVSGDKWKDKISEKKRMNRGEYVCVQTRCANVVSIPRSSLRPDKGTSSRRYNCYSNHKTEIQTTILQLFSP
jgi:hypothetical protein